MGKLADRVKGGIALTLAAAGLVLGLGIAAPGAASAAPPPPPVSGSSSNPQNPPGYMWQAIVFWGQLEWPNFRNVGDREWFEAASFVDPSTHQQVHDIVFTGGRFYDYDGRLRAFMNSGQAGPSNGYTGAFQEYNTTIYHQRINDNIPRRDSARIVRALGTGDVFWTDDHYKNFHYMGRR
jgi:hypothetical protein